MESNIRISQAIGSSYELELVWEEANNLFKPIENTATNKAENFYYFWYFSDGFFSTDPKVSHTFTSATNQIYDAGLLLKEKGPVVGGKPAPDPMPPADPPPPNNSLKIHVGASDTSSDRIAVNGITNINPLKIELSIQGSMVVAIIKYKNTSSTKFADSAYLRISFNHVDRPTSPLMLNQKPISFYGEWVNIAPPSENYRQAIDIGFENLKEGEERTIFLPFWGIYEKNDLGEAVIDLDEQINIEWLQKARQLAIGSVQAGEYETAASHTYQTIN